jgi:hypothetical protein
MAYISPEYINAAGSAIGAIVGAIIYDPTKKYFFDPIKSQLQSILKEGAKTIGVTGKWTYTSPDYALDNSTIEQKSETTFELKQVNTTISGTATIDNHTTGTSSQYAITGETREGCVMLYLKLLSGTIGLHGIHSYLLKSTDENTLSGHLAFYGALEGKIRSVSIIAKRAASKT